MRITVRVKPGARTNAVTQTGPSEFRVAVSAPAAEGKANEKLLEVLAEHFGRSRRNILILRGHASRVKIVEIT